MQLSNKQSISVRLLSLGLSVLLASFVLSPVVEPAAAQTTQSDQTDNATVAAQGDTQEERRDPPQANSAQTLSEEVFEAVSQIQEYLDPQSGGGDEELATAKQMLDELYAAHYESGNSFEKSTILNFYTNYYLFQQDYPGALRMFEQILTIADLRQDIQLRAMRSLGQLYAAEERWQESIDAYLEWQSASEQEDGVVLRGLSYANYQLEQWQNALDYWLSYWELSDTEELDRDDYAYLNGLYFTVNDYEAALELTKEMILRFNEQRDWDNLRAIHQRLDEIATVAELSPDLGGTLDFNAAEPEIAFATVIPTDGDYLPLVATPPMYPRSAADEGVEGWVLLSFTVNERGGVDEDSIVVEDADPPEVFNNTSVRAVGQFKFQPRMVSGEAQPVPDVQYLFRFALRDDDV